MVVMSEEDGDGCDEEEERSECVEEVEETDAHAARSCNSKSSTRLPEISTVSPLRRTAGRQLECSRSWRRRFSVSGVSCVVPP